jgi:acyl dehydratase
VEVTQALVDAFAEATGDHQWIHVDVERAKRESPFKQPIAHGYLTISLAPVLLPQVVRVEGVRMAVNYGLESMRLPAPVPSGARVRMSAELKDVRYRAAARHLRDGVRGGRRDKPASRMRSVYYVTGARRWS